MIELVECKVGGHEHVSNVLVPPFFQVDVVDLFVVIGEAMLPVEVTRDPVFNEVKYDVVESTLIRLGGKVSHGQSGVSARLGGVNVGDVDLVEIASGLHLQVLALVRSEHGSHTVRVEVGVLRCSPLTAPLNSECLRVCPF